MRRVTAAAIAGAALLLAAGCSSSSAGTTSSGSGSGNTDPAPVTVRLGFLENITHASALVALKEGFFTKDLGSAGTLKPTAFSTGTEETTAILAGQLDAAYVGPNPAINAWQKSGGTAIKIVSGAATGGASVVVAKGITSAAQLKGKTLATPSLGNTQDVALRYWLKQNGLTTTCDRRGRRRHQADDAQLGRRAGVQVRADRRRLRARALRHRDGQRRRHGAGQRARRHHPAGRDPELPVRSPGDRRGPDQGPGRGERLHQVQPDRRGGGHQRRASRLYRQAAQAEPGRGVVQGDHLHQ